jgi:soluble lytic murein transglycosylase-like protein
VASVPAAFPYRGILRQAARAVVRPHVFLLPLAFAVPPALGGWVSVGDLTGWRWQSPPPHVLPESGMLARTVPVDWQALNPSLSEVERWVRWIAPEYKLDPELVLAVVGAESTFDPNASSPKNAQGLMQLLPATARRFGVRNIRDPIENLRGGMAYLRWLMARFDGDIRLVLAAYNAGEGAVRRFGGIPPYRETQTYIRRVLRSYAAADDPAADVRWPS